MVSLLIINMLIHTPAPVYQKLKEKFGVDWHKGLIMSYAPNIHYKYDTLSDEKWEHEMTHVRQQTAYGLEKWWEDYIADPKFRLSQEIEAYRNEVNFIRKTINDREYRFKLIRQIAKDLSSSMYGNIISCEDAINLFR